MEENQHTKYIVCIYIQDIIYIALDKILLVVLFIKTYVDTFPSKKKSTSIIIIVTSFYERNDGISLV